MTTKVKTTQRATQTKISGVLATLLVSSGFVMTLPLQHANAASTNNTATCFSEIGNANIIRGDGSPAGGSSGSTELNTCDTNDTLTVGTGSIVNLTASTALITNLTATNLSFSNSTIANLTATNASITNLTAANATITNLTAASGSITSMTSGTIATTNLSAASGSITSLTSGAIATTNLTAANGSITSLTSGTIATANLTAASGSIGNLTTTNLSTTNFTTSNFSTNNVTTVNLSAANLNAGNANISNLNAGNANINGLSAANTSTTNLTAGNTTITNSLAVKPGATVDMGGNRVQGVVAGVQDTDSANMGQVRAVEKLAKQQGAIAAAATAIPQVAGAVGETTVGAGLGSSGGYAAVAVGVSSRISEDLTIKSNAGFSGSTKSIGIGFGYTFK